MLRISILLTAVLTLAAAGCSGPKPKDEEPVTLKVVYWDEMSFRESYDSTLKEAYPNYSYEVVSLTNYRQEQQDKGITDWKDVIHHLMKEKRPDLVVLNQDQFRELAENNQLADLGPFIRQDGFDLEAFTPVVADALSVNDTLYGVAPSFQATALYYNRELFERVGVELPSDRMTWQEALQLAGRFASGTTEESRIYGYYKPVYFDDLFGYIIADIGQSAGLRLTDAKGEVTAGSEAWASVWQLAAQAIRSGALYVPNPPIQPVSVEQTRAPYRLFQEGRIAMVEADASLIGELELSGKPAQWAIVTRPVDAGRMTGSGTIGQVFAIAADSGYAAECWNVLKHLHGERVMRGLAADGLPSRETLAEAQFKRDMDPFYALPLGGTSVGASLPPKERDELWRTANEKLRQVLAGTLEVHEALAEWRK